MLNETNLHHYQNKALDFFKKNKKVGLFLDTGLGKTITVLTALQFLYDRFDLSRGLIISTKAIVENVYVNEVEEWEHITLNLAICSGTPTQRKKAVESDSQVLVISANNIKWLYETYPNLRFNVLILDESTLFKNPTSARFRYLKKYLYQIDYAILLSGTPKPNTLEDLWSQIFILDNGERLGKNITAFRNRYGTKHYMGFGYIYSDSVKTEVYDKISNVCLSMSKDNYLDLPSINFETIKGNMTPKLLKMYKKLKDELFLELDNGVIFDLDNGTTARMKLIQFSSGFLQNTVYEKKEVAPNRYKTFTISRDYERIHNIKFDILTGIIEDNPYQQLIVVYYFKSELEKLREFGAKTLKEVSVNDWNDGKVDLLALHCQGQAHGLNLQKNTNGNTIIWLTLTDNYESYYQMNSRLHRQGSTKKVRIIHITVGEIEYKIAKNLNDKEFDLETLLRRIKK